MSEIIPINLAVEDTLTEVVLRNMLDKSSHNFLVAFCYSHSGFGYLKSRIRGFNNAAKGVPFLVVTDLDSTECPPILIKEWLPVKKHDNLLFRIAVRSIESWLIADPYAISAFLGISESLVPSKPDELENPKKQLIELTSRCRKRELREAIIPAKGSTAKIGPDYNGKLINFVKDWWDLKKAIKNSPSCCKTFKAIETLKYT